MLRMNEQKLLTRYLIQLLQLQAGNASPREFTLWRQRVKMAFPERRMRKAVKPVYRNSPRHFREDQECVDYTFYD